MPPTLDLSRTAHSKIIVSPPRINLRRGASYKHDQGPLSSTSSRFNFNHLVFSPPPSPGLPSLSPPPKKSPKGLASFARPSRILRYTVWLIGVLVIFSILKYVFIFGFGYDDSVPMVGWLRKSRDGYQLISREELPKFTTPILVSDKSGKAKWTVYRPKTGDSPLTASRLSDISAKCREMSGRVQALRSHGQLQQNYLGLGLNSRDRDYVDVREAQEAGYFPGQHRIESASKDKGRSSQRPTCEKSLTFVLESTDAGLGETLMTLWTAYGLAEKEGRAFFVDDSRWAYGKYADIFKLPSTACSAPPRQEIVPCPRQARHLIASSETAAELFSSAHRGPISPDRSRREAFALARQGHDALFHLIDEDAEYVDHRARELMAKRMVPKNKGAGVAVGAHIRRGDKHPLEFQYHDSYIPLSKYAEAAQLIIESKLGSHAEPSSPARQHSFLVLASDDPTVYESEELADSIPAQDRIKLANQHAKQPAIPDRKFMRKFVAENVGWEGGFFAPMFWSLGVSSTSAVPTGVGSETSAETLRLRSLVGRAYLMDLAVLADASDAVVCTASAAGCRLLAIMMGWESAMERGNWVNVDGGSSWMGVEW